VVGVFAALLAALYPPSCEQRVRVAGWVLELLGLMTVALDVKDTRRQFGLPSLIALGKAYLGRFPWRPPKPISAEARLKGHPMTGQAGAFTGAQPQQFDGTLESLRRIVEARFEKVEQLIAETRTRLEEEQEARKSAIAELRRDLTNESSSIRNEMKTSLTGGLHRTIVGLVWLALGLTLSTIPEELLAVVDSIG
jgi:hypothetical protein